MRIRGSPARWIGSRLARWLPPHPRASPPEGAQPQQAYCGPWRRPPPTRALPERGFERCAFRATPVAHPPHSSRTVASCVAAPRSLAERCPPIAQGAHTARLLQAEAMWAPVRPVRTAEASARAALPRAAHHALAPDSRSRAAPHGFLVARVRSSIQMDWSTGDPLPMYGASNNVLNCIVELTPVR